MSIIEALKLRGFTVVPCKEMELKIGKNDYIVKSVFTGKNQKDMSETFRGLMQKMAWDCIEKGGQL